MGGIPDMNGVSSNLFDQPYGLEAAPQAQGNGAGNVNGQGLGFSGRQMHVPGS